MKHMNYFLPITIITVFTISVIGFLTISQPPSVRAFSAPTVRSVSINSSSVGTEIFPGFERGAYVNSNGSVCIARLDDCSQLTSCIGLPLVADSAVSLSVGTDSPGRYCGILKSGSTPVVVGVNLFGIE